VQTVLVDGHADTSTASLMWAILAGSGDFAVLVNLVELQDSKLDLLVVVLGLLWLGVGLLLSLLGSTAQTENKVKGRLLLDVVIGEGSAILQLLSSEDQTLLVRRDSLLVLDLLFDIVDGVRRLNLQGNGLTSERLNENLHFRSTNKVKLYAFEMNKQIVIKNTFSTTTSF
jgi:hypothetical protein